MQESKKDTGANSKYVTEQVQRTWNVFGIIHLVPVFTSPRGNTSSTVTTAIPGWFCLVMFVFSNWLKIGKPKKWWLIMAYHCFPQWNCQKSRGWLSIFPITRRPYAHRPHWPQRGGDLMPFAAWITRYMSSCKQVGSNMPAIFWANLKRYLRILQSGSPQISKFVTQIAIVCDTYMCIYIHIYIYIYLLIINL